MRQKIKTVSAALMIGFVSFFLSFSVHINGTDVQPQADCAGKSIGKVKSSSSRS